MAHQRQKKNKMGLDQICAVGDPPQSRLKQPNNHINMTEPTSLSEVTQAEKPLGMRKNGRYSASVSECSKADPVDRQAVACAQKGISPDCRPHVLREAHQGACAHDANEGQGERDEDREEGSASGTEKHRYFDDCPGLTPRSARLMRSARSEPRRPKRSDTKSWPKKCTRSVSNASSARRSATSSSVLEGDRWRALDQIRIIDAATNPSSEARPFPYWNLDSR